MEAENKSKEFVIINGVKYEAKPIDFEKEPPFLDDDGNEYELEKVELTFDQFELDEIFLRELKKRYILRRCPQCKGRCEEEGGIGPLGEIEWLTCSLCLGTGKIIRKRKPVKKTAKQKARRRFFLKMRRIISKVEGTKFARHFRHGRALNPYGQTKSSRWYPAYKPMQGQAIDIKGNKYNWEEIPQSDR